MDFDFTDDQVSLRDAVARWVDKGFSFERRHAVARAGGATREVYGELAGLGLTALAVPEAHGGMGFGPVEAMVVMEELGRGLVNAPLAQSALIAPALLAHAPEALQAAWLPKIADATALVVLAHQERGARYHLDRVATRAAQAGGAHHLSGVKSVVPAGDEADAFIVPANLGGGDDDDTGIALFLVERGAPGVTVRGYPTQDGARAAELTLADTPAQLITIDGLQALQAGIDVGIAAVCAEGVGVMDKLVAITVDYMNTRKQFGATLASFQALRHRIADVKMQLELARSMSYYATLRLNDPEPRRRQAIAQAKVQIGNAARFVGQQCIQLHGGIGVTDEYIASHYFKRLTMIEMQFGDTLHHLGEVSARMQETAGALA
ncbi:acyl-CoA dehydrogenase family protein [Ideonella sp.]|uniref:acyl-CoA dehydrogenase family protein n=1 Tax=Ideonella sp. TaxID=1929293 RepID=UPI002B45FD7E|nr:acyl-CoA dehydrogenase family protein [Ideonella sp.]HJV72478.1 acyl-CoA dehydrogenase family protein [Ideonella sp.]